MARHGRIAVCTVDDEIMALRLAGNSLVERGVQKFVARRLTQRHAQIGRIFLAEAHIKRAGAGDADAVAALAEIMSQGGDEAEPSARLLHVVIARRTAGCVS